MDEFTNGVVDVAAPEYGLDDGGEVIVQEDDICGLLCHFCACDSHSEAYISFLESRSIVCTVPSHSDNFSTLPQPCNQSIFILRSRSSENSEGIFQFIEFLGILDGVNSQLFARFLLLLAIPSAVTLGGFTILADHTTNQFDKFSALHHYASIARLDDTDLLSDGLSCD